MTQSFNLLSLTFFRNSHYLKVQFEADSDDETIPRPIRFIFTDFMSQDSQFSVRNR